LDGKRSDEKAIVEITAIQLAPKVLKFEVRSDFALNLLHRKKGGSVTAFRRRSSMRAAGGGPNANGTAEAARDIAGSDLRP
jgi:hypothetical protein